MPVQSTGVRVRPLDELDIGNVVRIDEKISGLYRPDVWERRVGYYLRRDPEASQVAEVDGRVVGFMLADLRGGEFGLEEPSGWVERFGVDPAFRGRDVGKALFDAVVRHFKSAGVPTVRTLVDQNDSGVAGFLGAVGFKPSPLQALELSLKDWPMGAKA
jgi:ribosomal protein S18 acetylase RimI-like enzyme